MNAYDFIAELLLKSSSTRATLKMRYHADIAEDDRDPKWINTNYCSIELGKRTLGVTVVDDDSEECYIDSILKLKNYYIANNVKKTDKMFIETDTGTYPINAFDVIHGGNICIIDCK